jgi:hypothetical protein
MIKFGFGSKWYILASLNLASEAKFTVNYLRHVI